MEQETKIILITVGGAILMIFFVMLVAVITSKSRQAILEKENKLRIIEKQKQVELFRASAKAEENQKVKIAANLHDQIIPVLLLKTRSINNTIQELEKQGIEVEGLKTDVETLEGLSENIREIAHDLIPKLFTSFGLLKSIEIFIKEINAGSESVAEFHNNTIFSGEPPFSKNEQLIIYRITLEILNNLYKHAKYDYLNVSLEDMKDRFVLLFSHNGAGVTNEEIAELREAGMGIGLKSLQSRAILLNAEIDYSKDLDVSYVKLTIPIKNDRHN